MRFHLNWATVARLAELADRCSICRLCRHKRVPWCRQWIDYPGELWKLFSQEMGIAPKEIHILGFNSKELKNGASTGVSRVASKKHHQFCQNRKIFEEKPAKRSISRSTKKTLSSMTPANSWPDNPEALAILIEVAGISGHCRSDLYGHEGTNYGNAWCTMMSSLRGSLLPQFEVAER